MASACQAPHPRRAGAKPRKDAQCTEMGLNRRSSGRIPNFDNESRGALSRCYTATSPPTSRDHGANHRLGNSGRAPAEAGGLRVRSGPGAERRARPAGDRPRGRVHRRDARHRARRQRRSDPQGRAGADDRLSDHRGRVDLADLRRRRRGAGHVLGYDQETGFGLVQALGRLNVPPIELGAGMRVGAGDKASSPPRAAGATRSPRRSSPARNSPAIGNICSTARSLPRRRIRSGAAPR